MICSYFNGWMLNVNVEICRRKWWWSRTTLYFTITYIWKASALTYILGIIYCYLKNISASDIFGSSYCEIFLPMQCTHLLSVSPPQCTAKKYIKICTSVQCKSVHKMYSTLQKKVQSIKKYALKCKICRALFIPWSLKLFKTKFVTNWYILIEMIKE